MSRKLNLLLVALNTLALVLVLISNVYQRFSRSDGGNNNRNSNNNNDNNSNNNNRDNNNNNHGGRLHPDSPEKSTTPVKQLETQLSKVPVPDYKWYKSKAHAQITELQFMELLGNISEQCKVSNIGNSFSVEKVFVKNFNKYLK